jgi:hypothetical protein
VIHRGRQPVFIVVGATELQWRQVDVERERLLPINQDHDRFTQCQRQP